MTNDDDLFADLAKLVIGGGLAGDGHGGTPRPGGAAPHAPGISQIKGSKPLGGVSRAVPGPLDSSFVPPGGGHAPPTPWTPLGMMEFEMLWTALSVPLPALARHYRVHLRTLHRWREHMGLQPRKDLLRMGAGVARAMALRARAIAPILSPGTRALLAQAESRVFLYPWPGS